MENSESTVHFTMGFSTAIRHLCLFIDDCEPEEDHSQVLKNIKEYFSATQEFKRVVLVKAKNPIVQIIDENCVKVYNICVNNVARKFKSR